MNKKSSTYIITGMLLSGGYIYTKDTLIGNANNIIKEDEVKEKLSRKFILPSDEDIDKMSVEQLLEEIKNYDSDIIDMITNIETVNNQINVLENQIKSIDEQKDFYLEKDTNLKKENEIKSTNINKIKAFLNLPSVTLSEDGSKKLLREFNYIEESKKTSKQLNLKMDSLELNHKFKEEHLLEIRKMKDFLDKESLKVSETKSKVELRIEELNRRELSSSNPYSAQGNNVSIPDNIDSTSLIRNIIDITAQQIGVPYVWGGTTPRGFDCSGLLQYSFSKAGVHIPRVARDQQKVSKKISFEELRPGDLVFWNYPATHVALYIGDGKIIEAPRTGLNVRSRYVKSSEKGINYGRILN